MQSSGVTVVFAPCIVSTMYLKPHYVTSTFLYVLLLFEEASFMRICQIWRAINGQLTCNNRNIWACSTCWQPLDSSSCNTDRIIWWFTSAFVGNLRNICAKWTMITIFFQCNPMFWTESCQPVLEPIVFYEIDEQFVVGQEEVVQHRHSLLPRREAMPGSVGTLCFIGTF